MRILLALLLILPTLPQWAFAVDDVCLIRPDLCDNAPTPAKPAKAVAKKKPVPVANTVPVRKSAPARVPASVPQKKATVVSAPKKKTKVSVRCRLATEAYSLDDVDVPVCGSAAAREAEERANAGASPQENAEQRKPASIPSQSASVTPTPVHESSRMDFNSYMNSNSMNPALTRRNSNQQAFEEHAKPATFSAPAIEDGTGTREAAPAAPAPAASSSSTSPTSASASDPNSH